MVNATTQSKDRGGKWLNDFLESVNARLWETARLVFFFASPRHFDF